jgi:hypothetical protein
MKRSSIVLALALTVLVGCSKKEDSPIDVNGNPVGNTPRRPIPAEYAGTWYTGSVSPTNFYDPSTGGNWQNGYGSGMFYKLNADGTFEFGWQTYASTYGCTTRGMVYRRGTATVQDSVITLYDNFAHVSGKDNCVASSNYDRAIELKTETIILQRSVDEYGNRGILIRNPENNYSWFRPI